MSKIPSSSNTRNGDGKRDLVSHSFENETREEREKRRSKLRRLYANYGVQLQNVGSEHAEADSNDTTNKIQKVLQGMEKTFNYVDAPTEAVMDSRLLSKASALNLNKTERLKFSGGAEFDLSGYVSLLDKYLRSEEEGDDGEEEAIHSGQSQIFGTVYEGPDSRRLESLGKLAYRFMKRPNVSDFMVGPLDLEVETRKKKAYNRTLLGQETKALQLSNDDLNREDANRSTKIIRSIFEILRSNEITRDNPIGLFEFVINPHSFSQTVENIFYVSFLVRDNKVAIDADEDGLPIIYMINSAQQAANGDAQRQHLIFDFDETSWKELIEALNLEETAIPTREALTEV